MEKFINKKLTIVCKTHPRYREEVIGKEIRIYTDTTKALICECKNRSKFYVFNEADVKIIK